MTRQPSQPIGVRRLGGVAEIRTLVEVRAAAKDWQRFSSRLQGDPDVRDYPQLPLEVDPPEHGAYRALLEPILGRRAIVALEPGLRSIARGLVDDLALRGRADGVFDLAVPMVASSIAIVLGRPQDAAELASWGITSWQQLPDGTRSGARLDAYVDRALDQASTREGSGRGRTPRAPEPATDAFRQIAHAAIDGRPLTRVEQVGLANLVLAGGRDTVILLLAGAMWHLATNLEARRRLRADPTRIPLAIEEYLRYLSPNVGMERRATARVEGAWGSAEPDQLVVLGWGPANHDPSAFDAPGEIRLDRRPNPHLAFGSGPHTCIGVHLARLEARVFLEELVAAVPGWRLGDGLRVETIRLGQDDVPALFQALPLVVAG